MSMTDKDKKFDNYDDFLKASETGESEELADESLEESQTYESDYSDFKSLFPRWSIDGEVARSLIRFPDSWHERVMGVCMVLMVMAAFSPVMSIAMYVADFSLPHLSFVFGLGAFFILSVFVGKMSFWFPLMGVIVLLKAVAFRESAADSCIFLALFLTIYLMHRIKSQES